MKITAYKCPDTGKIFEYESYYRKHRFEYIAKRRANNKRIRKLDSLTDEIDNLRQTAKTSAEIITWLYSNGSILSSYHRYKHNINNNEDSNDAFEFTKISLTLKKFDEVCSNSHCSPLTGGKTNWGRISSLPMGYPGWKGRLEYHNTGNIHYYTRHALDDIGIFCGSGSGYSKYYGCEITIFAVDWPGLYKQHLSDTSFKKLSIEY